MGCYDFQTKQLIHKTNKLCLDSPTSKKLGDDLFITECSKSKSQQWILEPVPWK